MREFAHEFVDEFFVRIRMNFFARKIGYVTNGLYCMCETIIKEILRGFWLRPHDLNQTR